MTWTYDTALATSKDQVRFWLGDTDTSDQLLSDEEIAAQVTAEGTARRAAIACARALAAKFGRKAQSITDDIGASVRYGDRAQFYLDLAAELKRSSATLAVTPFAGGISIAGKQSQASNTDRVPPAFTVTTHDTAGATADEGEA